MLGLQVALCNRRRNQHIVWASFPTRQLLARSATRRGGMQPKEEMVPVMRGAPLMSMSAKDAGITQRSYALRSRQHVKPALGFPMHLQKHPMVERSATPPRRMLMLGTVHVSHGALLIQVSAQSAAITRRRFVRCVRLVQQTFLTRLHSPATRSAMLIRETPTLDMAHVRNGALWMPVLVQDVARTAGSYAQCTQQLVLGTSHTHRMPASFAIHRRVLPMSAVAHAKLGAPLTQRLAPAVAITQRRCVRTTQSQIQCQQQLRKSQQQRRRRQRRLQQLHQLQ